MRKIVFFGCSFVLFSSLQIGSFQNLEMEKRSGYKKQNNVFKSLSLSLSLSAFDLVLQMPSLPGGAVSLHVPYVSSSPP